MNVYALCSNSVLGLIPALIIGTAGISHARTITDMTGRTVTVPDVITRVYAPSPYGSAMLYSVAPEKMAGLMSPILEEYKKYLDPSVYGLPVIGRLNKTDEILQAKPDLIIVWTDKNNPVHRKSEEILARLDIPYVYVAVGDLADLSDYPAAYDFLGSLLGKEEHTARQSTYCRNTLDKIEGVVQSIPKSRRPRVYLAEGKDGLCTECDDSLHVHVLRLAGDVNVHRCHTSCHKGFETVTLDQVKAYDPDVIFVQDKEFYHDVKKDPEWSGIKAVRENRVYLIPKAPFNWFDRPPSFMRILGIQWVMTCLYPEEYPVDIIKESRVFFELFLNVNLTPDEIRQIIQQ